MTRSAFFTFLIICLIVRTSVAQHGNSLSLVDLAQSGKAEKFLPAYRKQINSLFENRNYDSALVLLNTLRKTPVSHDKEVNANIFLDIAIAYDNLGEVTKAGIYFEDAQKLATEQEDKSLLAETYYKKGRFYYRTSGMDSSLRSFEKAAGLFKELKDTLNLCNSLAQIGMVLDNNGIYAKALDYYFEALRLEELRGDSSSISGSLNNIAIIYKKQEDLVAAEDYYLKAKAISEARGDRVSIAYSDVNLGLLYKDLGKLDMADSILNNCLRVFIDENNAYAQTIVYHNIGAVKLAKKEWATAREFFARSLELSLQNQMAKVVAKNHLFLGKLYFEQQKYYVAERELLAGLKVAENNQLLEERNDLHRMLAKTYRNLKDYESALEHFEIHMSLKDSIFNDNTAQAINRLKLEYEVTQKDIQIVSLEKEADLKDGLVEAERTNSQLLVIFVLALILFIVLIGFGYRNRTRLTERLSDQNALLAEQKEEIETAKVALIEKNNLLERTNRDKDDIIGIVAHDLRSPLNRVKGLLNIIKPQIADPGNTEMINLALKSTDILRDRVNRILDVEAINAGKVDVKLERLYPENILDELLSHFSEVASTKEINLIKEINTTSDRFEADRNYLFQVLENLLSNAIKYSPRGKNVWVSANKSKRQLVFAVKDEGPGIAEEEQKKLFQKFTKLSTRPTANEDSSGLGLSIVKKYVDAMGGDVWCESTRGYGSSFYVAFNSL